MVSKTFNCISFRIAPVGSNEGNVPETMTRKIEDYPLTKIVGNFDNETRLCVNLKISMCYILRYSMMVLVITTTYHYHLPQCIQSMVQLFKDLAIIQPLLHWSIPLVTHVDDVFDYIRTTTCHMIFRWVLGKGSKILGGRSVYLLLNVLHIGLSIFFYRSMDNSISIIRISGQGSNTNVCTRQVFEYWTNGYFESIIIIIMLRRPPTLEAGF